MMTHGNFHIGGVGRLLLLIITSLCWAGSCLPAQPAQLDFRHYTIDDGLPSSEVYTTFEDREGFLWIGTDNGVARFDGYDFTVFDADDGLEDMVVFNILEDEGGKLWISTYSGRIYYFENGGFHPSSHNDIITELKKVNLLVILLDVTSDGDMIVNADPTNIFRITPAGEVAPMIDTAAYPNRPFIYQRKRTNRLQGRGSPHSYFNSSFYTKVSASGEVELEIISEDATQVTKKFRPAETNGLFALWNGSIWTRPRTGEHEAIMASSLETIIIPLSGGPLRQYPSLGRVINFIMPGNDENDYWIFLNRGRGLERHVFLPGKKLPQVTTFLNGHSISSGNFDRNGGFWVTTLDDGIYYCPYPQQELYLKDDIAGNAKSISLALTGPKSFYAGYDDGTIFRYDEGTSGLRDILTPQVITNERMFSIFYDSINTRVYTSFFSFSHPLKDHQKLELKDIQRHINTDNKVDNFAFFNYFPESHPAKLFASRGLSFSVLPLDGGPAMLGSRSLGLNIVGGHVLGIDLEGRILLGTLHGLYEITSDGRMIPNNLGVEELSERVVFIKHVYNDALLFGTRGNGLIYLSSDTSYQIRESDGLASDMIRDIHKDNKGNFWISTLNGLSKVIFSKNNSYYTLRTFRLEHGLPTNEVSKTDTWGDEVWLATSAGIVHFVEPSIDSTSSKPAIRQVLVNGKEVVSGLNYELPAGKQDVSIHFGSVNYFLEDRIRYRYRIIPDAPWQHSSERTANYPNLGEGTYQFAVQSRNQDGFWSESTLVNIFVATPWYATWWATGAGILALIGALSTYFLFRERRRKREQNLLLQINELEHAALHAQMNPHFVFNALNSIQNFVLQNDAKQAATYLSRFARIIRQTLRSSVDGKHTLKEELDMLRTYLVLEKLRFKDGFNYELTVSPDLSLEEIDLPPLLIQPFVENAIIHGLKDRKRGGWISIDFSGTSETLSVQVEDNGTGFDPTTVLKNDSLGMDITRRRLEMMNRDLKDHSGMIIEPLKNDGGMVCGTRVTLSIQLGKPATTPSPAS